ncbi:bifunctional diguanylate cyclase/phosphodiesterase [Pseudoteredinibacter isoporae]|uniref:Diguanylate cyclase (GGDEF)-like protein n=1 Tax=Pseudoteredinibacter isoporae TaxID=570281 RepID=A0A7X0MZU6_9GAMM|nr:diguanylate cyclase (GGDEF)-like protein [Pseudoteredinibacter isoporae]NHO89041.1 bifunctional diguanylate cyclase/phosphodiesterase [Pseudoteredinibacter isoporae]
MVLLVCRQHLEIHGRLLIASCFSFASYFLAAPYQITPLILQLLFGIALASLAISYLKKHDRFKTNKIAVAVATTALIFALSPQAWMPYLTAFTLLSIAGLIWIHKIPGDYSWAPALPLTLAALTGLTPGLANANLIAYLFLSLTLGAIALYTLNRKLYVQANSDPLSQLPNRRCLNEHAEELAKRGQSYYLLLFTLNGIKQINDTYGFAAGDRAIWIASRKMLSTIGIKDFLGRNFAKEFVIITERQEADLSELIETLEANIHSIESINKHNVSMGIHCGLAFNESARDSFSQCLQSASAALQFAESQQLSHAFVNDSILESVNRRNDLEQGLRQAISDKTLQVHFQPKYDCQQPDHIVGAEALARWQYKGENISPFEFIKLAEECKLIADLDRVIMEKSWVLGKRMQEKGIPIKIAANFSPTSLLNGVSLLHMVQDIIRENDLDPQLIEIEITESYLAHGEDIKNQLQVLRDMGISVAMDDFGTGFSNLGQLEDLPLDTLKIDKIFVDKLLENPTVTEFIVDLAQKLQLQLVAEGVEENQQLQWLNQHSCQMIQGYLLSRPLPEADFVALLEQNTKRPAALKIAK